MFLLCFVTQNTKEGILKNAWVQTALNPLKVKKKYFHKYFNLNYSKFILCSAEERKSYRCRMTLAKVNDDFV